MVQSWTTELMILQKTLDLSATTPMHQLFPVANDELSKFLSPIWIQSVSLVVSTVGTWTPILLSNRGGDDNDSSLLIAQFASSLLQLLGTEQLFSH